jgi:hypothetical protein
MSGTERVIAFSQLAVKGLNSRYKEEQRSDLSLVEKEVLQTTSLQFFFHAEGYES